MILASVTFHFIVKGETVKVSFRADKVRILRDGKKPVVVNNFKRPYGGRPCWPCATHCKDLIELAMGKKRFVHAGTAHQKQRRAAIATKKLGVFKP